MSASVTGRRKNTSHEYFREYRNVLYASGDGPPDRAALGAGGQVATVRGCLLLNA